LIADVICNDIHPTVWRNRDIRVRIIRLSRRRTKRSRRGEIECSIGAFAPIPREIVIAPSAAAGDMDSIATSMNLGVLHIP